MVVSETSTSPTISGVTFGGTPTSPTITVSGSGFGTLGDLGSPTAAGCGASGSDYGTNFMLADTSAGWSAGSGNSCIGLVISSYSDNEIAFTFGNGYGAHGSLANGAHYAMTVLGTTFNGTVSLGTSYFCDQYILGGWSSPIVMSESPVPPSSIDAGGTFETAPAAQVTFPASIVNEYIGAGIKSLTIDSQTARLDGRSSIGGPLSGAVSPNVQSASTTNLPQSRTLAANTPFTYDTAYNPVTWKTGPGTGKVYFTPGGFDIGVGFSMGSSSGSLPEIECSPFNPAAALASTTVDPPAASPTFQEPSTTPPLQNQASSGTDGGWGVTVSNTSKATVDGLKASLIVTDGGAPLIYDVAGMAASGTTCSTAGSGKATCAISNLPPGDSVTLNVLVSTNGLSQGKSITGSAAITASNASPHSTGLGAIKVAVVDGGNGTEAVATPGIPLTSTKNSLSKAKTTITLTLPRNKIKVVKKAGSLAATAQANPPPVPTILESLSPTTEPALCPPTGATRCQGFIAQAVGNFSAYTNKLAPIKALVTFQFGVMPIPPGSVYMLKPNGIKVVKLPACKKAPTGYNTPCVEGPEVHGGHAFNDSLYAQDTVYFVGTDPAMGRR